MSSCNRYISFFPIKKANFFIRVSHNYNLISILIFYFLPQSICYQNQYLKINFYPIANFDQLMNSRNYLFLKFHLNHISVFHNYSFSIPINPPCFTHPQNPFQNPKIKQLVIPCKAFNSTQNKQQK